MQSREIIIIGGGIIGLAIAVELRFLGAKVTVLCADFKAAASHAAAGMLAPQAEEVPPGAMLDLCLASRALYPEWVSKIEAIAGVSAGYWPCGILAPRYTEIGSGADWLDRVSLHRYQTGLTQELVGGYWYPDDGQVDNRALTHALWLASQALGVEFLDRVQVEQLLGTDGQITKILTSQGEMTAQHYILANGAWSQDLLPIPIVPRKGQMLSVLVPPADRNPLPLQRVLFGEDIYIVPRQDGRIILGATSENVGFAPQNTVGGINTLLSNALRLFPQIKNYPIQSMWWGYRPATADELPILGDSNYQNLTLATGHYRNGILLAPITAKLISDRVWSRSQDERLNHFHWRRFAGEIFNRQD
jgi:glycine oxidase ThiO